MYAGTPIFLEARFSFRFEPGYGFEDTIITPRHSSLRILNSSSISLSPTTRWRRRRRRRRRRRSMTRFCGSVDMFAEKLKIRRHNGEIGIFVAVWIDHHIENFTPDKGLVCEYTAHTCTRSYTPLSPGHRLLKISRLYIFWLLVHGFFFFFLIFADIIRLPFYTFYTLFCDVFFFFFFWRKF